MSGAETAWMPLYVRDILTDTNHMTMEEFGSYVQLLCISWATGKPVPADEKRLAKLCRMSAKRFAEKVAPNIMEKFSRTTDGLTQKRLEIERQKAKAMVAKNSRAGKASAEVRALKKQDTPATGVGLGCNPLPEPSPKQEPKTEKEERKVIEPLAGAPVEPIEPKPLPRVVRTEVKRKSRLDPSWQPTPKGFDAAREVGMRDVDEQVLQFRDYHAAKGNVMVDWDAAWRTWCRNSVQFSRRSVVPLARKSKLSWMTEDREALNVVPANMFGD